MSTVKLSEVLKQLALGVSAVESFVDDKASIWLKPKTIRKATEPLKIPEMPHVDLDQTVKNGRTFFNRLGGAIYAASTNAGLVKRPKNLATPAAGLALAAITGLIVFDIVRHQRAKI